MSRAGDVAMKRTARKSLDLKYAAELAAHGVKRINVSSQIFTVSP
jgi:hypothetical protein